MYNSKMYDYTSHSIATATTNGLLPAFVNLNEANYVKITSNQIITVRFNSTSNAAFPFVANTPISWDNMKVDKIYVTNASWSTATILVELHP